MAGKRKNLLDSSVYKGVKQKLPIAGVLRSIRLTWEAEVDEYTVDNLIEVAQNLADSSIKKIYKNGEDNLLFALVQFDNMITAEIEINGRFVNKRPPAFYIYTNSTDGILTNRPVVGHFPVDGSILINENEVNYERCETIFHIES